MIIRQEEPKDYAEVYEMVKQAFATTSYTDGTEQDYLNELREKESFIPQLSLVAVDHSKIIGQIVLYEMSITGEEKIETQLVISPLSVLPAYFRCGIGSALLSESCEKAKQLGYKAAFLCGEFSYYSKQGFVPTYEYGIYHEKDAQKNAQWCMVKELVPGFLAQITGTINIE